MMIMQSDFYIIQHGLVFKKADILKGSCNSGFINIYGFLSGNIFSIQYNASIIRFVYTGKHIKYGCFTCTVWSNQSV